MQVCRDLAWINARCPPKPLYHSSPSAGQGRKHGERLISWDQDRERSLANYHHRQNRLDLGKLVYHQSNQIRIMRN